MNNFLGKWDWVVVLCLMSDKESHQFSNYFYVKRKIFWLKYFPDLTWAQEILPSETKYTTLPLACINTNKPDSIYTTILQCLNLVKPLFLQVIIEKF